jgi:hypothetical protein
MFTLEQANGSLVLVRRILRDAVQGYERLNKLQKRLQRAARQGKRAQIEAVQGEYQQGAELLNRFIEELNKVGCELKDLEIGVVVFPAMHQDKEIRLSWQLDEDEITHYHGPAEGFIDRKPLPAGAA